MNSTEALRRRQRRAVMRSLLFRFLQLRGDKDFRVEHVEAFARQQGLGPFGRAWGPVIQQAWRDCLVSYEDYDNATGGHGHKVTVWRAYDGQRAWSVKNAGNESAGVRLVRLS